MAFLDNSGDIILDAVLTDTGRMRLARGDGTFKISKFALGDDEIDYSSYDGDNTSGSAYYDLEILQTPIFEAFTNNTATMKSKLVSLTNNNLLYLPVIQLNQTMLIGGGTATTNSKYAPTPTDNALGGNTHIVFVDEDTRTALEDSNEAGVGTSDQGFLNGIDMPTFKNSIRTDQGLNTTEVSPSLTLDPELRETQYIVEIDSRFASIYDVGSGGGNLANPSFIDDDSIASYYLTKNVGNWIVDSKEGPTTGNNISSTAKTNEESILGPRGTTLKFGLKAAVDLVSSEYLFTTLGGSITIDTSVDYFYIDL